MLSDFLEFKLHTRIPGGDDVLEGSPWWRKGTG